MEPIVNKRVHALETKKLLIFCLQYGWVFVGSTSSVLQKTMLYGTGWSNHYILCDDVKDKDTTDKRGIMLIVCRASTVISQMGA